METEALSPLDARIAARIAALRMERSWSLDMLAQRSGISRTTLSRLERGETSPTAALLGRLCTAFGRSMSRLIAEAEAEPVLLLRADEQAVWTDPETGLRRRLVSPPAAGFDGELLELTLPAGRTISYAAPCGPGLEQHLWMLGGTLELTVEETTYRLQPGDCLRFRLFGPTRFLAPGPEPARYVMAVVGP